MTISIFARRPGRTDEGFPLAAASLFPFGLLELAPPAAGDARPSEWGWLLVGIAVLAVLLVFLVTRLRTRSLDAERRRLEEELTRRGAELEAARRAVQEASVTDPLTGLRNRRYFSLVIEEEARRTIRAYRAAGAASAPSHRDLIFYLLDLDHFRAVNEVYGEDAGDRVLVETVARLRAIARQCDLLIRWGGEEFLIVSRDTDRANGHVLAQRVIEALAGEPFDLGSGLRVPLSGSVGWAPFPWDPFDSEAATHDEVLRAAERALDAAKKAGRNRSVGALPAGPDALSAQRVGKLAFHPRASRGPEPSAAG
jgi:diguanylate cyclase (GGDEF)-like protein